jgi:glycosyltransferase involved in cell wall biosynthesis
MLSYSLSFLTKARAIEDQTGQPQVIIVSSSHPFHYLPLYWYAKRKQIPLIFEVRDLWPSSLQELLHLKPWHPIILGLSLIEKHAYRKSTQVVSLLSSAKSYMVAKGLNPQNFHYIPNGTDCQQQTFQELGSEYREAIQKIKDKAGFVIAYLGAMGPPNALIYLLEAMNILSKTHPEIHCLMIGKGELASELKKYCQTHALENVHFFDPIPKPMVFSLLQEVDLAYLGWQDTPLYQYGVSPNKIFDYMLAAKPILESGGAPVSMVETAQCGWRCNAADPKAIAQHLIAISQCSKTELNQLGQRAKDYVLQHHDYPKLAQDYTKIFENLSTP